MQFLVTFFAEIHNALKLSLLSILIPNNSTDLVDVFFAKS